MMHTTVGWHVEMEFQEDDEHTRAVAMVRLPDGSEVQPTVVPVDVPAIAQVLGLAS